MTKIDVNAVTSSIDRMIEEKFFRVNEDLASKIWSKIRTEEYIEQVLKRNYSIFSISNWSRNDSI